MRKNFRFWGFQFNLYFGLESVQLLFMYKVILFAFVALIGWNSCSQKESAPQKPNILYIMSDDHTSQAFGIYGSRLAKLNPTPTLDKIAGEGIIFDNAFCNNAICTPSRASIITGQYPQTNGVLDLDGVIAPERQYLPMEMKKLGYETAMVGKWHLHDEPAKFDYYCVLPGQGKYHNPDFRVRGDKEWPNNIIHREGHSSTCITDVTLDWLKTSAIKANRFL